MKNLSRLSLIFVLLLVVLFAFPANVHAQAPGNDQIVFGGTYTLMKGQSLTGNLIVLGGVATIEEESTVTGDVVLAGGTVTVKGEVTGDIISMGGSINLTDTALVKGDISTIGSGLTRSPNAIVNGSVYTSGAGTLHLPDSFNPQTLTNFHLPDLQPIGNIFWSIFQTLAMAALALLVALFLPKPTERVANVIINQPMTAGGLGLLTVIVAPALLIVLAITILLIPLSLIGIFLLTIAFVFGWIAVGMETGKRLSQMFKTEWSPPINAGLGTLVLSLVSSAVSQIPCVGWVLPAVIAIIGLGGVLITRFGTQGETPPASYFNKPTSPASPISPESQVAPLPPVSPFANDLPDFPEQPAASPDHIPPVS
jgi:cytoskeletal protein CcmA (bactofilin family)